MERDFSPSKHLHLFIVLGFSLVLVLSFIASWLTSLRFHGIENALIFLVVLFAMFAPFPAYWHQRGLIARRDAALTIPCCLLIWAFIPAPFLIAARLHLPLQDTFFLNIDRSLGISGPAIVAWASHHPAGHALDYCYHLLYPYLEIAIVAPALLGKPESKRFLLANVIAMAIGIPLFALLPAVGPWYSEHFAGGALQIATQNQLFALRDAQTYSFGFLEDGAGIVAFPSFHVIWSILAASALWGFRFLRVPLVVLSTLIIISTMTTGWHYFADILGGLAVVTISLMAATAILKREATGAQDSIQLAEGATSAVESA